jgi:hypothetical protein
MVSLAALGHNGLMEAGSEVFWQLVNLVIAVNLDSLFGGVHHDMAFVAPMQMLIEFSFQAFADLAV